MVDMSRQNWWQRRHTRRNSTAYPPRVLLTVMQKAPCSHTVLSELHFDVRGIQENFKGFNLPITHTSNDNGEYISIS